jgi:hypothetical protein
MEAGQLSLDFDNISEGEKRVITGPATKQVHQNCHCIILKASIKSKTRSLANYCWTTLKKWQCDIWHNWLAENISTEPLSNQKHITRLLFLVKGHWTHDRFLSWQKSASRVSSVQTHHKVIVFGEAALDSRSVSVMTEVSVSCLLCSNTSQGYCFWWRGTGLTIGFCHDRSQHLVSSLCLSFPSAGFNDDEKSRNVSRAHPTHSTCLTDGLWPDLKITFDQPYF